MVKSAYIHIPFCKSKCNYCSFVSYCSVEKKDLYLKNLQKEIEYFYENELLKTLYIGGGTPSLLTTSEINNIINTKLKSNTKYSNKALLNKIRIYLKTLGYQDYLINISLDNIKLDNSKEDEKLKKDYEKLYKKYKNKYDKSKLSYILTCKL